jgi:hypothetical protein
MHLSERELKHVSDLRKYVHHVQRWRWFYVGAGIALLLMFFALMFYFLGTGLEVKAKIFGSHPAIILAPILGGFFIGLGIQGIRGNLSKDLLIKVVEHLSENGS